MNVGFDDNNNWATFYWFENLEKPVGLNAYVVTGYEGKNLITQSINFIPANKPLLLERTDKTKTVFTGAKLDEQPSTPPTGSDIFKGTTKSIADLSEEEYAGTKFVLLNDKFVKVTDGSLPANRCYLNFGNEDISGIDVIDPAVGPDDIVLMVDNTKSTSGGSASKAVGTDGKVTLTVIPSAGYYAEKDDIIVTRYYNGGVSRAPSLDNGNLTLTAVNPNANPSGTTTYTFTPEAGSRYQVIVKFHQRISFNIKETQPVITLKEATYVYDGKEKKPQISSVTMLNGTVSLVEGKDYTVVYSNNVNAGSANVIIYGIGRYTGDYSGKTFSIGQRDIKNVAYQTIADQIYTGSEIKPAFEVTDIVDIDGVNTDILNKLEGVPDYILKYSNNINVGVATVAIESEKKNYQGTKTGLKFNILPKDLSHEDNLPTIEKIADQKYTGDSIKPALVIKDGELTVPASNYDVIFTNNVKEGTATTDITFKGNYKGTAKTTFKIVFNEETKPVNVQFEGEDEWTTYYSPIDLKEVEGLKIFVVIGLNKGEGVSLATEEVNYIPKNVGVLLQRTDKTKTTFSGKTMPSYTELSDVKPDTDLFRGTSAGIEDMTSIEGIKYILLHDNFIQVTDGALPANRCYVFISNDNDQGINHIDGNNPDGVVIQEEGSGSTTAGEATLSEVDAQGYKTITVTPVSVTYAGKDQIKVVRSINNTGQAASRRAPGIENTPVEIIPVDAKADPSGVTQYKFKYDANYHYQITIDFQKRITLSGNTNTVVITLKAADIQNLEYDGKAKTPAVEEVTVNGKTLNANEYEVTYSNNINAGSPKVTIIGKRIYKDSKDTEFKINQRDFSHVTVKEPIPDQKYNDGNPIIFENLVLEDIVKINDEDVNIVQEGDYTIHCTYTEIGAAKVSFRPAYINYTGSGTKEYSFNIIPATGIEQIPVDELEGQWYDLNGQRLQGKPTQKGVYILRTRARKSLRCV